MESTIKCDNCAYSLNGSNCEAKTLNKAKYRACLKQESDLPNFAQIDHAKEQKRKELIEEGFCPECESYLTGEDKQKACTACNWRE